MAHAFMTTGDKALVLEEGFVDSGQDSTVIDGLLRDPLDCNLTNPNDRSIIAKLRSVAERSQVFTCFRAFINQSTESCVMCFGSNICCC
jgi:hypothetical protein